MCFFPFVMGSETEIESEIERKKRKAKQTPLHCAHMDSPQDLKQSNKIGSKMALLSFFMGCFSFQKTEPLILSFSF